MRERTPEPDSTTHFYDLLEVNTTASQAVIQAAYRALVRNWHPDLNSTPEAAERIRQLNAAYDVLSDPARRARYDLERARQRRRERSIARPEEAPSGQRPVVRSSTVQASVEPVLVLPRSSVRQAPGRSGGQAYSGQFICAVAFVVAVVAALAVLVWVGLSAAADDGPDIHQPPVVEFYSR